MLNENLLGTLQALFESIWGQVGYFSVKIAVKEMSMILSTSPFAHCIFIQPTIMQSTKLACTQWCKINIVARTKKLLVSQLYA